MKPVSYFTKPTDFLSPNTKMTQTNFSKSIVFHTFTEDFDEDGILTPYTVAIFHVKAKPKQ